MGVIASYETEGRIYAKYILQNIKDAKIGVLYQNDDLGKDYYKGLQDGLGDQASSRIVKVVSYELSDPTIDSQIIALKASGANVLFDCQLAEICSDGNTEGLRLDWRPTHFLSLNGELHSGSTRSGGSREGAWHYLFYFCQGSQRSLWDNDKGIQDYVAFMKRYFPDRDPSNVLAFGGYGLAQAMIYILEQCGDNLTRENVMYQATHMHDVELPSSCQASS